jgi:hypothetical protein
MDATLRLPKTTSMHVKQNAHRVRDRLQAILAGGQIAGRWLLYGCS